ncbi:MAG: cupin domain-containing protein [Acidaminococcales bacterium]|jgi:mannose-6-phosphate isomerase-like protein (cupin superfamily)|nr:cupin domain-containing protein [Acidaminococcales bacterium]
MSNLLNNGKFVKNPVHEGVFAKFFYSGADGGLISNQETIIVPGFEIAPHTHENSTEFFYCAAGEGEFLDAAEWRPIKKGDAFRAPQGVTHALRNTGRELLVLLCTFSPAIR